MKALRAALWIIAALLLAHLVVQPLRHGFTHMDTDFPNYYTAAKLVVKREPLRNFYDWVSFQRQIHYAGIDHQLGGYVPHTPLTMLPFVPLVQFSPQRAKQVWLAGQLLFLAACIVLLANLGPLSALEILVLALLAHNALSNNLRLGQYYVFILLLLTLACWCLLRGRPWSGGALLGVIFAVKLYTAPFLFYFAARRQWKALLGFAGAIAGCTLLAVALFGWSDVWYFISTVMARAIDGSVNDPYNPGWASMTALLRKTFMAEPELNPHPLADVPAVFFVIRALYAFGLLGIACVALLRARRDQEAQALAWFIIILFALSPNAASYHFVLLLVPAALLLTHCSPRWSLGLLALYILTELPLFPWDAKWFPKAWLLLALFFYAGWTFLRHLRAAAVWTTILLATALSAGITLARMRIFNTEAPQNAQAVQVQPNAIFSSAPVPLPDGWLYDSIARDRYAVNDWNPAGTKSYAFDGDAFNPTASHSGDFFVFELAAHRASQIMRFDRAGAALTAMVDPDLKPTEPSLSRDGRRLAYVSTGSLYLFEDGKHSLVAKGPVSHPAFFPDGRRIAFVQGLPGYRSIQAVTAAEGSSPQTLVNFADCFWPSVSADGRLIAFACSATSATHIWVKDLASGQSRRLTNGFCNDDTPAWYPDARSLLFASDCSRGLGLPALYQIDVPPKISGR